MLKMDIILDELMDLKPSSVGDYCEALLDAERLRDELLGSGPFGRKSFCAYLGIGESTLTGWFQSGRIPRVAAEAYVLFLALEVMQEEIRRLEEEAEDPKVIETNGKYAICEFRRGEDGAVLGQVVAENIPDLGKARAVATGTSVSFAKFLKECAEVIEQRRDSVIEGGGAPEAEAWFQQLMNTAENHELLLTDYDAWKRKRLWLDDLLKESMEETRNGGEEATDRKNEEKDQ